MNQSNQSGTAQPQIKLTWKLNIVALMFDKFVN